MKKAQYSDIRAEEVRHFLRRVSRLVSSQICTLSEARRTKLFVILLSLVKSENLNASNQPFVRRTFTALIELFRHLFVSLHLYTKNKTVCIAKLLSFDHSELFHCCHSERSEETEFAARQSQTIQLY